MTDAKAERLAGKAAKAAALAERRAREASDRAALARAVAARRAASGDAGEAVPRRGLQELGLEFGLLAEKKRTRFLSLVRDFIPLPAIVELHAGAPPQRLEYDGADIRMRVLTQTEAYRLRACAKEPFTIAWLHDRVGSDDVVYDIGANVGSYSLVAALKPNGGARVVAFEPSYANVASLYSNLVLNGVGERVTVLPVALSDRSGLAVFRLRDLEAGSARHVLEGDADGPPEEGDGGQGEGLVHPQTVMTLRLDDAVAWFGLPAPNHIKLDVDGGELAVLQGAAGTLRSDALRTMLVEVSASLSDAVVAALAAHGLRLEEKRSVLNKAGEYGVWYGLFVR